MSRNNKFLLVFAVAVIVPVVLIWTVAWPILRPWSLPDVTRGVLHEAGDERNLMADEISTMNQWLHQHQTGWGVSGEVPPKDTPAEAVYTLFSADGKPIILSTWHFRHGADVVGIQTKTGGEYRMRSFERGTLHLPD
ncbi:hypothetical protein NQF86_02155 [Bombella sp. TMW 2.2543]|uniref:Uncharacterized protein n=1 Tax=Bombella pluederhausensis TaxID=2967336 RepID=A0ABT3WEE6_9PROT|nr:hypothetical protein [Bombella pluederhausensis]MCX5617480.1 hypothetical protein [Bombella pluederhausensis]